MRMLTLVALAAATVVAVPATAQDGAAAGPDAAAPQPSGADTAGQPTAPDHARAFGIDPYVAVMSGWEQFDNEPSSAGIPQVRNANGTIRRGYKLDGALVQAAAGFNVPLGPVFVGAEGNVVKGVSGDIDWEYGAAGRFGVRAGDSGLFYGKVGYQWVNFEKFGKEGRDYHAMTYGIGAEFALTPMKALAGNRVRLRTEVNTFGNAHSFRPMLGVVTHF